MYERSVATESKSVCMVSMCSVVRQQCVSPGIWQTDTLEHCPQLHIFDVIGVHIQDKLQKVTLETILELRSE